MNENAVSTATPVASLVPRPWGFWMTLFWAVLAAGIGIGLVAAVVVSAYWGRLGSAPDVQDDPTFPLQLIASNAGQILVVAVAARAAGWPAARYLALDLPRAREVLHGLAAVIALILVLELITHLVGRESVTPFQTDSYRVARDAGVLPLMWVAFVLAAPLGEEILFRGFAFRGWEAAIGAPATILLTSVIFAILHTQYDWFGAFQTFCMGALLAWLRWRSGSTTLTIALHMLINFVATTWAALKVAGAV